MYCFLYIPQGVNEILVFSQTDNWTHILRNRNEIQIRSEIYLHIATSPRTAVERQKCIADTVVRRRDDRPSRANRP